jgi:hypothetical protein
VAPPPPPPRRALPLQRTSYRKPTKTREQRQAEREAELEASRGGGDTLYADGVTLQVRARPGLVVQRAACWRSQRAGRRFALPPLPST